MKCNECEKDADKVLRIFVSRSNGDGLNMPVRRIVMPTCEKCRCDIWLKWGNKPNIQWTAVDIDSPDGVEILKQKTGEMFNED